MAVCAFVSFRLGLTDGVSVVAASWRQCFEELGWETYTVAGEGPVDHTVPGLEIDAVQPPDRSLLVESLAEADLVVVENLLTIPLNLGASRVLSSVLRGRPAILHHHDPPWQRDRFAHIVELPPDDPAWHHVTINNFTRTEFSDRGLNSTTIYNGFDTTEKPGDREATRLALGLDRSTVLVVHPVRAIARKNIPAAIAMTEALGGSYWLPGPPEEDYEPTLHALLSQARCPVIRTTVPDLGPSTTMADVYAACDLVAFPSTWEGFGNPPIEAAIHHRLAAVGDYPASRELRMLGFEWFDPIDTDEIAAALDGDSTEILHSNRAVVDQHLSFEILSRRVKAMLQRAGLQR